MQLRFDSLGDGTALHIVGALRQSRRFSHFPAALLFGLYVFRDSSGSLAIFAAIRRASSCVSGLARRRFFINSAETATVAQPVAW
jgi:hypothetical protein